MHMNSLKFLIFSLSVFNAAYSLAMNFMKNKERKKFVAKEYYYLNPYGAPWTNY